MSRECKNPVVPNNAFARRMAKFLEYGTVKFDSKAAQLSEKISEMFPGRKVSKYTIKSWLSQGKFPQRKNLELVAKVLEIDPDELIAADENDPNDGIRVNAEFINTLESVFEMAIHLFGGNYIRIDTLPPEKVTIIKNVLQIKNQMSLSLIEHATELGLKQDKEIEERERES